MKADERRKAIANLLLASDGPLTGAELARRFEVSRPIIVQDVAVMKAAGYDIVSTHSGYVLQRSPFAERVFKVRHDSSQTPDELMSIVGLGATVVDVYVRHKVYGVMRAQLNIATPSQVSQFVEGVRTGKSTLLMGITGGYHYHTVRAADEATLDAVEAMLAEKGYLVPKA